MDVKMKDFRVRMEGAHMHMSQKDSEGPRIKRFLVNKTYQIHVAGLSAFRQTDQRKSMR